MSILNPYAIYIKCDGAMDYDSKSTGGVGFVIEFPESISLENIEKTIGRYEKANIERLELNAILQGMNELLRVYFQNIEKIKNVNTIIVVTDRYSLDDNQKTSPYKLREYRKNGWKNHEGKAIKNKDLLDNIDKIRKKISDKIACSIKIEYQSRKKNKIANKLAKKGKKNFFIDKSISKNGLKIGKRKFNDDEVDYSLVNKNANIIIHVFKKELVGDQWEICADIMNGRDMGKKVKIYTDKMIERKLHRHHIYEIKVKVRYRYHIEIFRTIKEYKEL
jgi:ribonuclease HI